MTIKLGRRKFQRGGTKSAKKPMEGAGFYTGQDMVTR